ncbi:hypothetical protein MRX96_054679 [Rhipicephalus microplus]
MTRCPTTAAALAAEGTALEGPLGGYDHHGRMQQLAHSPHPMNAAAAMYTNHGAAGAANHVMGAVPDVHKRDKDAIYGLASTKEGAKGQGRTCCVA